MEETNAVEETNNEVAGGVVGQEATPKTGTAGEMAKPNDGEVYPSEVTGNANDEQGAMDPAAGKTEMPVQLPESTTKKLADAIKSIIPEHVTIQRVNNGFIISIPSEKHRIAYTLVEVIEHVKELFERL